MKNSPFIFKIPEETKYRKFPSHIKQHLLLPVSSSVIKIGIGILTFFVLNFSGFLLLPVYTDYMIPEIAGKLLYPLYGLLGVINVWMMTLILRKAEKTRLEMILFTGCLGGAGSISYFICAMFYCYLMMIRHPLFFVFMLVLFCASLWLYVRHYKKKYSSLEKYSAKFNDKRQLQLFMLLVIAWLGISHYCAAYTVYGAAGLVLLCLGTAATYQILLVHMIHKYLFIKANRTFVV